MNKAEAETTARKLSDLGLASAMAACLPALYLVVSYSANLPMTWLLFIGLIVASCVMGIIGFTGVIGVYMWFFGEIL